jgi:DNA repair photolyase
MVIKEIFAKSILSGTGIPGFDYCVNPYVGCAHACRYCYASFMKRFTGHQEPWGDFVDVKVNAPQVLRKALKKRKGGRVIFGSVTDPYQPLEKEYAVTRGCLEAFLEYPASLFEIDLLTRSPLCLRDIDLFTRIKDIRIGFSIGTQDEAVKRLFEPRSPAIRARVEALRTLHEHGVQTYVFIGPMLPMDSFEVFSMLKGIVSGVLIDRMNYSKKVISIYRRSGLERYLEDSYFKIFGSDLRDRFEGAGIPVTLCW